MKTYKKVKVLFLLSLILVFPIVIKAQLLPEDRNYKIGIKGGLNFSNLTVHNVDNENTRVGFNLGLSFKYKMIEHFSVQPELIYSSKGSELTFNRNNFFGIARINLNYLDLPILLVYNPTPSFNVHLGPYIGFLAYTKVKTINEPSPDEPFYDLENEITGRNFRSFDTGIVAGMGVEIGIFTGGLRYNFGTTEIGQSTIVFGRPYGFSGARNRLAQIYVGVAF
ncbi:MAG: PorT family protein [Bacteroidota bacterium]|nr:PorT family protein [Bacteroidota bacterium]